MRYYVECTEMDMIHKIPPQVRRDIENDILEQAMKKIGQAIANGSEPNAYGCLIILERMIND